MPRTIWKGSLNFGLVNVPVGVYPATQDKTIHFNQFESGTSDRIRYKKVNERTGKEVTGGDIVKGVDLGGGEYVILSDEELASAEPVRSKLIEITEFVDLDEIDPVYFRSTYYLAPEGDGASKAYALLRQVMRDANKIAIGTFVMRNKEYPVAIRPDDDVLKLETMYFSDEIRSPTKELPDLPNATEVSKREVDMALLLLESMESEWDPNRYHDTHRQKVEALIEEKRQGHDVLEGVEAGPKTNVVDLMEALSASVKSAKSSRDKAPVTKAKSSPASAPARRTASTKSAAKPAASAKPAKAARAKKTAPKVAAQRKAS
jgi:DNA end-binding protein Ku